MNTIVLKAEPLSRPVLCRKLFRPIFVIGCFFVLFFLFSPAHGVQAATQIYRSVGPGNSSALATGNSSFLLTISGDTATFSGDALPDNVGVGDVIVYDTNGSHTLTAADSVVFISGRNSDTSYIVKNESGINTAATTAGNNTWAVYRAYTALSKATDPSANTKNISIPVSFDSFGGSKDLTAANEVWNIACYGDAPDDNGDNALSVVNWTTSATDYVRIYTPYLSSEVGISQRHAGVWDSSKYNTINSHTYGIYIDVGYTKIEGLQVESPLSSDYNQYTYGIELDNDNGDGTTIDDNIIKEGNPISSYDSGVLTSQNPTYIYNNIIYGFKGFQSGGIVSGDNVSYVYGNTVFDCYYGIGSIYEYQYQIIKNNVSFNNVFDYSGTFINESDYNAYGNTVPYFEGVGANNAHGVDISGFATSTIFTDWANNDFLIKAGSPLIDAGSDLSGDSHLAFSTDIINTARPQGLAWDIGADELVSQGGNQNIGDMKTAEFYVYDSSAAVSSPISQDFSVYIGDNIGAITNPIKSAYFKISGTYTGGGTITLNLNSANSKVLTLPTVSIPTYFELLYADTSSIINPTSAGNYTYNFGLIPSGLTLYGTGVKLEMTYQYAPNVCFDGKNQKVKTTEFYVYDSSAAVSSPISQDFPVYIGDNIGVVSAPIKSAYFKVSGTYTGGGSMTVTLNSGNSQTFTMPTVSNPTYFEFLYADNSSIISPATAGTYTYNFGLTPTGVTIYGAGVKLELTYQYKPPTCNDMPPTGELTSVIYDTTQTDVLKPAYNSIMWEGTSGTGKIRFQLATADSPSGPWNFFGSSDNGVTCNSSAWYDSGAPDTPAEIACASAYHNNQRYYRYKVQLCSNTNCTTAGTVSPEVDDVIVNWSP
jgi:hypothetical protein